MVTSPHAGWSEVAGLKGGRAGANSQFHRNRGQPDEEVLGNRDIGHCNPGDVIRIIGAGAGSGGDPLDRPADEAPDLPATAAERARPNCSTTETAAPPSRWSGRSSATTC